MPEIEQRVDTNELRELAEAAAPGPWTWKNADVLDTEARAIASTAEWDDPQQQDRTTEFIAAANPDVVLALLDELDAAREREQRLRALTKNTQAAMHLWWTASGDDWAVPDYMPGRFLRAALDGDGAPQ